MVLTEANDAGQFCNFRSKHAGYGKGMVNGMEWNQLQRFLVVAREENISKAAQILDTSQPSLSQIIKRLEEELGYELFEREGKRIRLNESGRIMMQAVMQMDELMGNTKVRLEELNGIKHPEVSIHFATASTLLPELLLYLRKRDPQIQYRIHQWKAENTQYENDIQILAGPIGSDPYVGMREKDDILLMEEICLAIPSKHALMDRETLLLGDLIQEEFINLNEHWELGRAIRQEMDRLLFAPKMTMMVDNPNMMRELLKSHLGIAFVPAVSWRSFAGEEIAIRPVEDFRLKRVVYLRTSPRKYLTREQKQCLAGIKEFFAKYRDNISR